MAVAKGLSRLLLIKPESTYCEVLQGCPGHSQVSSAEVIAQEIKAPFDATPLSTVHPRYGLSKIDRRLLAR